jgi:general secretion pathway protein J
MDGPLGTSERDNAGFTLVEVLAAVALLSLIMGALAAVTAQWLPGWNRGLSYVQRNEQVAIALDRLAGDLAAAEFVSLNVNGSRLLFGAGQEVMFVRSAVGPNNRGGLEVVRIAEIVDSRGPVLVRTRARFRMLPAGVSVDALTFGDPVVLLRPPLRLRFSYADADGQWADRWTIPGTLPTIVRFDVQDEQRGLVLSTASRVHVDTAPPRPEPPPEASRPLNNRAPPNLAGNR